MSDKIHDGQHRDVREKSRIMEDKLVVSIGGGEVSIEIDSILYVESRNRKVAIHMAKKEIEYYDRIMDLEELLGRRFYRTHRGFLVNMDYVERFDRTGAYMTNGELAMISKYKFRDFCEEFQRYRTDAESAAGQEA